MPSGAGLVFVATIACNAMNYCEPIISYRPYYSTNTEINCDFWGQFVVDKAVDGLSNEQEWKASGSVCEILIPYNHKIGQGR